MQPQGCIIYNSGLPEPALQSMAEPVCC